MIKFFNKKEKTVFYLIAFILLLAIYFNFVIMPILDKGLSLNIEINYTKDRLIRDIKLLSKKQQLIGNSSAGLKPLLNLYNQKEDSVLLVLSELEKMAGSSKIRIIDMRPQVSIAQKKILIDLRGEGSLESFMKFIYELETSPVLLQIKKLQFNARPEATNLEGFFSISQIPLVQK